MQDPSLAGAILRDTIFTGAFDAMWAVGSRRGEVRVWHVVSHTLHLAWQAHADAVD